MNRYKKTLLLIGVALAATQAQGMNKNEVGQFIADKVTNPFQNLVIPILYNKPIPKIFFNNLSEARTKVQDFIKTTGSSDAQLMTAFGHVNTATNVLINGMQDAYQKLSTQQFQAANSILLDFITVNNNMTSVKNGIDKITYILPGKKEARDLLATFCQALQRIADDAQLGIVKKLPKPE